MSKKCQVTGRGPRVGHNVSHAHNVTKRRFNLNLQKVRVLVDGQVKTMRVSTKAIKSGLIEKPPIRERQRRPKRVPPPSITDAAILGASDEPVGEFFSEASVVTRMFKPKKKAAAEGERIEIPEGVEGAAAECQAEEETRKETAQTPSELPLEARKDNLDFLPPDPDEMDSSGESN